MKLRLQTSIQDGDGYRAVLLPYSQFQGMLIILPHKGMQGIVERRLDRIVTSFVKREGRRYTTVDLSLPRFHARSSIALADSLRALGATDAFDPERADYAKLTSGAGFAATTILHAASVGAYEGGTNATYVARRAFRGQRETETTERIVVDRPFVFAILDRSHEVVLFLGRVSDPGPSPDAGP